VISNRRYAGGVPGALRTSVHVAAVAAAMLACGEPRERGSVVTFPGSAVGAEAQVLRVQLARFMRRHPGIRVVQQQAPDAANLRHQLYVQWLNARADDPDILQLDLIWTPEFAAAGWLLALDRFRPPLDDFLPAAVAANRYLHRLYALPWFVDVGMLYYRSDVLDAPPRSQSELVAQAQRAQRAGFAHGLLWQGARYEGLVTVFSEYLAAFGGEILDRHGRVALDSRPARTALEAMRAAVHEQGIVPRTALSWQEEQSRFAFQNGRALFMRNWPYAFPLLQAGDSAVQGRVGVAAVPPAPGGRPAAALGGSQLAINARSDQPEAAYAVVEFLLQPAQMLERARVAGQFPPRPSLYSEPALARALPIDPGAVLEIIGSAVARPATPVYAELSDILQIHVHRCLTGQQSADRSLRAAAREIEALLARVGLTAAPGAASARDG
jgi:multiple sugar transport system substrate-binding protein